MQKKYYSRWIKLTEHLAGGNKARFSEMIGMSAQAFQSYLARDTNPGAEVLLKLAGLGVNVNWFLTGEGEMMAVVENPSEEMEQLKEENQTLKRAIVAIRTVTDGVLVAGRVKGR